MARQTCFIPGFFDGAKDFHAEEKNEELGGGCLYADNLPNVLKFEYLQTNPFHLP